MATSSGFHQQGGAGVIPELQKRNCLAATGSDPVCPVLPPVPQSDVNQRTLVLSPQKPVDQCPPNYGGGEEIQTQLLIKLIFLELFDSAKSVT